MAVVYGVYLRVYNIKRYGDDAIRLPLVIEPYNIFPIYNFGQLKALYELVTEPSPQSRCVEVKILDRVIKIK